MLRGTSASMRSTCQRMDIPNVTMTVSCSKGTYIRTLVEDIGTVARVRSVCDRAAENAHRRLEGYGCVLHGGTGTTGEGEHQSDSMIVAREAGAIQPKSASVVTVGTFDGVHLGHRAIIRRLTDAARESQGEERCPDLRSAPADCGGPTTGTAGPPDFSRRTDFAVCGNSEWIWSE